MFSSKYLVVSVLFFCPYTEFCKNYQVPYSEGWWRSGEQVEEDCMQFWHCSISIGLKFSAC